MQYLRNIFWFSKEKKYFITFWKTDFLSSLAFKYMKAATNHPVPLPQWSMFLCLIVFIVKIALVEKGWKGVSWVLLPISLVGKTLSRSMTAMLTVDAETGKYVYFINYLKSNIFPFKYIFFTFKMFCNLWVDIAWSWEQSCVSTGWQCCKNYTSILQYLDVDEARIIESSVCNPNKLCQSQFCHEWQVNFEWFDVMLFGF